MTIESSSVETAVHDLYRRVFTDPSETVLAVGFDEAQTAALVDVLAGLDDAPTIRLLTRESVLKWLRDDFLLASSAANLLSDDTLSLRNTEETFESALLVTDESVVAVVEAGDRAAGLATDDDEFVAEARERWTDVWEAAEAFTLRTPARSRVHESLAEALGPDVESDFRAMMGALETARGDGDDEGVDLDEVVVSLLAAAKNEALLYDVSRWGEDVGVASTATFSRTKTMLEDRGLIDTAKVPIDVGRPRLRLLLGDDRLREADADELASVAQSLLSTNAA